MRIAVLFDGAGLSRLGLEQAGHECVGVELDPWKHHLSQFVGSGSCVLGDATEFDLSEFDGVWASPPCAQISSAIKDLTRRGGLRDPAYQGNYLQWCLQIEKELLWVENVTIQGSKGNDWGTPYNAAQFERIPKLQNRNRIIGGRYPAPKVYHEYKRWFPGICSTITATEYKGSSVDKVRASRHYGRALTIEECAYHMGFKIPKAWYAVPDAFMPDNRHRAVHWKRNIYQAIGNGVPVYMAKAFGRAV